MSSRIFAEKSKQAVYVHQLPYQGGPLQMKRQVGVSLRRKGAGVMGGGVVGRVGGAMLNPKKLGVKTQGSIRSHPSHLLRLMLRQYWLHL